MLVNPPLQNLVVSHILHHSQEQAFRPVPQRVNFIVEQAGKPVAKQVIENSATSQLYETNWRAIPNPYF